jgi:alpha-beta hydrolase superfamily lysophospholipase
MTTTPSEPTPSASSTALPHIHLALPRGDVRAIAVVLHGGRDRSTMATRPTQVAVLRMLPFAWALRRMGRRRGIAVARVRFRVRGWNGSSGPIPVGEAQPSPVADATAALDWLTKRYPEVPIVIVGHSMGGRTALRVGGYPGVRAIVGLAPWVNAGEPYRQLAGRDLLILHGTADTWTDPAASARLADAAASLGARVSYLSVIGGKHSMLQSPRWWHGVTAGYVAAVLDPNGADQSIRGSGANLGREMADEGREPATGSFRVAVTPGQGHLPTGTEDQRGR